MDNILNIKNVSKTYQSAGKTLTVLDDISFSADEGATLAIVGPSGSGKTTLLDFAQAWIEPAVAMLICTR